MITVVWSVCLCVDALHRSQHFFSHVCTSFLSYRVEPVLSRVIILIEESLATRYNGFPIGNHFSFRTFLLAGVQTCQLFQN